MTSLYQRLQRSENSAAALEVVTDLMKKGKRGPRSSHPIQKEHSLIWRLSFLKFRRIQTWVLVDLPRNWPASSA
ncbi:hypothetical protein [Aminobacterium mobile]|jgi:hypothetical protein|uniref:hypothetical protein n=1 Tax=Aminobacterium mobile TaxID=81467 RepID=UPI002FDAB86C